MLDLLDLEFQIAVSHSGWWELNLILCRSRKCCLLLNQHSSPKTFSFMDTKLTKSFTLFLWSLSFCQALNVSLKSQIFLCHVLSPRLIPQFLLDKWNAGIPTLDSREKLNPQRKCGQIIYHHRTPSLTPAITSHESSLTAALSSPTPPIRTCLEPSPFPLKSLSLL